ncbi:MAG TPA: hypothetical protein VLA51_04310 [Paracoccaceae bacterium]|nr:hypothetical protein [Paracoccaceae bacterium]
MFTTEHEFDSTRITLVDFGSTLLREDVQIDSFEDRVVIRQYNEDRDDYEEITLSINQLKDLRAALALPEGAFKLG